jgi:antitoxin (DNA-binding transcriptional repressor) of toxin-antitoxin stability system
MTVREIRQKWPEAEKALAKEGEIVVTRDSKPVAKIIRYAAPSIKKRPQFDPEKHLRWLRKISKGEKPRPSTDELLRQDRHDDEQ